MTTSCQSPSAADQQQSVAEDSNAQRLRENQRRSRLRRKEYVASIESQLREFQRNGAEASREVQQAAKHVVRENRQLRDLLRHKGVPDCEVDAWLKGGSSSPSSPAAAGSASASTSIDKLQRALVVRRPSADADVVVVGRRKSTGMVVECPRRGGSLNSPAKKLKSDKQAPCPPKHTPTSSPPSLSPPFSLAAQDPAPAAMAIAADSSQMFLHASGYAPSVQQQRSPQGELYLFHTFQQHQQQQQVLRGLPDNFMAHHRLAEKHPNAHHRVSSPDDCAHSAMQCDAARSIITELQPHEPMDGLTRELCPQGSSEGCVVDTAVLFGVMDRACL